MKKKIITLVGVASPLMLLFICVVIFFGVGAISLLLFDNDEESSRTIRILSLAPLATVQAVQEQLLPQEEIPNEQTIIEQPEDNPIQESQPVEADTSLSPQEIEEALGFSLPADSVNSITQVGLADRLVIPKLNLDAPILLSPIENQTWKVDHLGQSVGHLEGTASPGSDNNFVLAAHVTISEGVYGPFAGLGQLSPGDVLFVYDDGKEYQYVIDGFQTVDRMAVDVTYPTSSAEITLITCSNWDHNEGRYVERLIVKGHLVEG